MRKQKRSRRFYFDLHRKVIRIDALVVMLTIATWIECPPIQIVNNITAENLHVIYVLQQSENLPQSRNL